METRSTDHHASDETSRWTLRNELFGPPRRSRSAQFSVVAFGLLLVVSLVVPTLLDAEISPGLTLMATGFMFLCGVAEVLDPRQLRFAIALRFAGSGIAVLGCALQLI